MNVDLEDIDIIKTKQRNRLVYKSHWIEFYEIFAFAMILAMLVFPLILILKSTMDLRAIISLSSMIIVLIFITIYKIVRSRQFYILHTGLPKKTNKLLLADYIEKNDYKLRFHDNDYLRAILKFKIIRTPKELTVIFDDNQILINIVSYGRIRFPLPFELKKFINGLKEKINTGT